MKEAIWATQNALKECRQQIIDQNEALIRARMNYRQMRVQSSLHKRSRRQTPKTMNVSKNVQQGNTMMPERRRKKNIESLWKSELHI